jgi:hypothetical protein
VQLVSWFASDDFMHIFLTISAEVKRVWFSVMPVHTYVKQFEGHEASIYAAIAGNHYEIPVL